MNRGWSELVAFHPFEGEGYSQASPRLLVLGEGHYGYEADDDDATTITVANWMDDRIILKENGSVQRYKSYFTKNVMLATGLSAAQVGANRSDAISPLAFYNYSQSSRGDANVATDWSSPLRSEQAFAEVLCELSPDLVIVNGRSKLWQTILSSALVKATVHEVAFPNLPSVELATLVTADAECLAIAVDHMTRGSPTQWRPAVEVALATVTRRRV